MCFWLFSALTIRSIRFPYISLLVPLRKKKCYWFVFPTTDHQTKWHCHSQEARQTASSDYEDHGLCAVAIPEEDRPCYYGPGEALLQALVGRVVKGKENLGKSHEVQQMSQDVENQPCKLAGCSQLPHIQEFSFDFTLFSIFSVSII